MGRKSLKDIRQKKIIKAFYKVAKKEGVENTSFAKVAKVLDMPPSLLVHYFSSKEELLLGLIDFIMENYKAIYQPEVRENANALENLTEILNNIFSRKWDKLFDDGLFYDCFALIFRDDRIKKKYKELHLLLREWLTDAIQACKDQQLLEVEDPAGAADLIFVISDGAYYYLSMIDNVEEHNQKLSIYKNEAFKILNLENKEIML